MRRRVARKVLDRHFAKTRGCVLDKRAAKLPDYRWSTYWRAFDSVDYVRFLEKHGLCRCDACYSLESF